MLFHKPCFSRWHLLHIHFTTIVEWNSLPVKLVSTDSNSVFKSGLTTLPHTVLILQTKFVCPWDTYLSKICVTLKKIGDPGPMIKKSQHYKNITFLNLLSFIWQLLQVEKRYKGPLTNTTLKIVWYWIVVILADFTIKHFTLYSGS